MEKRRLEILVGAVLIILLSCPIAIYALGYFDSDGDGIIDLHDAFPYDPIESKDSDGDGIGDYDDALPYDPDEQYDNDGDGVGNNADVFPNDPKESIDTDSDGIGDNSDAFPNDPVASKDSDYDGYPDEWNEGWYQTNETTNQSMNITNLTIDAFPYDPDEQFDNDSDGVGNNLDVFPDDPKKWRNSSDQPKDIMLDASLTLSNISNGISITFDGIYYYALDYNQSNKTGRVLQFSSNFSFTGIAWNCSYYVENPTGITFYDNQIYVLGRKFIQFIGRQAHIFTFTPTGEYNNSKNIGAYVDDAQAITCCNDHIYVGNSRSSEASIHIFNASSLVHVRNIDIGHTPSDLIIYENGNWSLINDQLLGEHDLYLYDLIGNYQNYSIPFHQYGIELIEDTLIALSGDVLYIYKLI